MNGIVFLKKNGIILFFAILYIFSVGTDPILGDSLAFTVIASKGFDLATNATNHFLYINFLAILHKILPFINPHYLFVDVSIVCSLLTLIVLRHFFAIFNIDQVDTNILILLFGFSFTFWRISIITEVYSFYILFVILFLYFVFLFNKIRKLVYFYYASILFGVLFLIHIQTILLIPFYLYFLYDNFKNSKINLLTGMIIPLLIFCVLLIPVFQGKHNFISIFTDNAWGASFFDLKLKTFTKSFIRNFGFLIYNFLLFLIFIPIGLRKLKFKEYFLIALIPYILFVLKHDVSDSYVFHLVPYLFVLVLIGRGIENVNSYLKYALVFSFPVFYFLTFNTTNHMEYGKEINSKIEFKGGVRYLLFPPLNGNPIIDKFIDCYENKNFDNVPINEKENFKSQYQYSKDWVLIRSKY